MIKGLASTVALTLGLASCSGGSGSAHGGDGGSDGGSGSEAGGKPTGPVTITGTVIDDSTTVPVPNAAVYVVGQKNAYSTDQNGKFSIPNVKIPYDLAVGSMAVSCEQASTINVYAGLTRQSVRVRAGLTNWSGPCPGLRPWTGGTGSLTVNVDGVSSTKCVELAVFASGGAFITNPVGCTGSGAGCACTLDIDTLPGETELSITAMMTPTTTPTTGCGEVFVGQVAHVPVASSTATIHAVASPATDSYILSPPGPWTIQLSAGPPWWAVTLGSYDGCQSGTFTKPTTVRVPHIPGTTAIAQGGAVVALATPGVQVGWVPPAAAPALVSPVGGSISWPTNVVFRSAPGSTGVFGLGAVWVSPGVELNVLVLTASTSYFVPDLAVIGAIYSSGDELSLTPTQYSIASVDDLADPGNILSALRPQFASGSHTQVTVK